MANRSSLFYLRLRRIAKVAGCKEWVSLITFAQDLQTSKDYECVQLVCAKGQELLELQRQQPQTENSVTSNRDHSQHQRYRLPQLESSTLHPPSRRADRKAPTRGLMTFDVDCQGGLSAGCHRGPGLI